MQFTRTHAEDLDKQDKLAAYRSAFHFPTQPNGNPVIYLCGNSLGLQPKKATDFVMQEMRDWQNLGVEGHFHARNPWMPYHEFLTLPMAEVVGAKAQEVVVMNTLTANLHLLMVSFYRPTAKRYKILIESHAFPSDRYAVASQAAFHGYEPADAIVELPLREGEETSRPEDINAFIEEHGQEIALIMIGGVNYYTGQLFPLADIVKWGHAQGCVIGFDLAHAAGNIPLALHDDGADFAAWCTYKYLNGGPGCIAGLFVHERHAQRKDLPRFAGWWGHNKETRFNMRHDFDPMPGAEGWQLSNPPILPLACLRASLSVYQQAGMQALREKSENMIAYFMQLLEELPGDRIHVITPTDPAQRGCQLSIQVLNADKSLFDAVTERGVIADWREPDVIRVAAAPLYNSYADIWDFVDILKTVLSKSVLGNF